MTDVAQVGGKNASLGEMVSNLSGRRRQRARAASRRRPTPTASSSPPTASTTASAGPSRRSMSPDVAELARVGANVREWIEQQPLPAAFEADIRAAYATLVAGDPQPEFGVVGGALQRDRGGSAGCVVRGSAGDVPEHQRHREHPRRDPQRVRVALQRPGDRVPRAPRLRPPRRRALRGRPADGAIGCRRLRRAVHRRHRVRLRPRGVHHQLVRARRGRRAGRREPRRVLRLQARPARRSPGDPEAVGGGEGHADGLRRRHARRRQHRLHRRRRQPIAAQFSITDAEVEELGRQALVIEDHYGRPMDIEWGKDGIDGKLYILQARPETVVSRVDGNVMRRFVLEEPGDRRSRSGARSGRRSAPARCG